MNLTVEVNNNINESCWMCGEVEKTFRFSESAEAFGVILCNKCFDKLRVLVNEKKCFEVKQ